VGRSGFVADVEHERLGWGVSLVLSWFWAFVFTQVIEVPIYVIALGRRADPRSGEALAPESLRWRIGFGFLATMATHPYVWFVIAPLMNSRLWGEVVTRWPALAGWHYPVYFVVAESFAVIAEALLLRALRVPRALLWALAANATSSGIGLLMNALGWL
jgi:hypothetical protein